MPSSAYAPEPTSSLTLGMPNSRTAGMPRSTTLPTSEASRSTESWETPGIGSTSTARSRPCVTKMG